MYKKIVLISLALLCSAYAEFYYSQGKKIELNRDTNIKRGLNSDGIDYYTTNSNRPIGVDNKILIGFNNSNNIATDNLIENIENNYNIKFVKQISDNIYSFQIDLDTQSVFDIAKRLYVLDYVEFAHPNLHIKRERRTLRSDDPLYSKSWHIFQADINNAWDITKGSGVKIGIIDDAVEITHEDLKDNIANGYDFDNIKVAVTLLSFKSKIQHWRIPWPISLKYISLKKILKNEIFLLLTKIKT